MHRLSYAPEEDMVLILDVARFKYPPHWVSVPLLWESMAAVSFDSKFTPQFLNVLCHFRSILIPCEVVDTSPFPATTIHIVIAQPPHQGGKVTQSIYLCVSQGPINN